MEFRLLEIMQCPDFLCCCGLGRDAREGHPYGAAASLTWWLWYSLDAPTACLELVLGTFLALKFSVPLILLGKKKKKFHE